jgi:very-short-patch-repair endonuclease
MKANRYPAYLWTAYGLNPAAEVQFAPPRKWRFDFCFPEPKIAIEIEGGLFIAGRHGRGAGARKDMEKYNMAGLLGWRVFRFLPEQLRSGAAQMFMQQVLGRTF